jgi:hypothetical protein
MILALVTPNYLPSVRGKSIAVQRIEPGLHDQDSTPQDFSLDWKRESA